MTSLKSYPYRIINEGEWETFKKNYRTTRIATNLNDAIRHLIKKFNEEVEKDGSDRG